MKILKFYSILISLFLIYSCSKDESLHQPNVSSDQKPRTEASLNELKSLNELFSNGEIKVDNGTLRFSDSKAFKNFLISINYLNSDQLLAFENKMGYKSFYTHRQEIEINENPNQIFRDDKHLYLLINDALYSKILFEKASNNYGFYYFNKDIVFNSNEYLLSEFENRDQIQFAKSVKDFILNGVKAENIEYLKYDQNNSNRSCGISSQTDIRNYTVGGNDRWFRTTINLWVSANPIRNNLGQVVSWDWYRGWGHNIKNFKKSWTGLYWVNGNGPLYIKTDAYVTGNTNFQWMWQTCGNCNEINYTKVTSSGNVCCTWAIPFAPIFEPLLWFIGKVEEGTPDSGEEQDCDTDPTICFSCG